MEIAFFLPTSIGEVAAVAHLPEASERSGEPVLLLSGGRAGRRVVKGLGEFLAGEGSACLRFDYPGSGATAVPDPLPRPELLALVSEIGRWWRESNGSDTLTVVGRCLGARLGVAMAARDRTVTTVAGIYLPVKQRSIGRRLRDGAKAIDARGPRLASKLVRGPRVLDRAAKPDHAEPTLTADLRTASQARFRLLFGANDSALTSFEELLAGLPADVRQRVETAVLPGGSLHGIPDVEHEGWVREQIGEALTSLRGSS